MKKICFLLFVIFSFPLCSRAQYFDWVKTYENVDFGEKHNYIRSSVVDTNGNLYFVGTITPKAKMDGQPLLPFEPYGYGWRNRSAIIGKLSPSGDLLWHKVIHINDEADVTTDNICLVGDSIIMCNFLMYIAGGRQQDYVFFLDTLIPNSDFSGNNYFCPYDIVKGGHVANVFLTFNLEGVLLEKHSIDVIGINNNGDTIMYYMDSLTPQITYVKDSVYRGLSLSSFEVPSFNVDNEGNIIICREVADQVGFYYYDHTNDSLYRFNYSVSDGSISQLIFLVDGKKMFPFTLPDIRPSVKRYGNYQLLKFSPHFEDLLATRYLFKPSITQTDSAVHCDVRIKIKDDNIYLSGSTYMNFYQIRPSDTTRARLYIDGLDSALDFRRTETYGSNYHSFVVKYNPDLKPEYFKRLYLYPTDTNFFLSYGIGVGGFSDDGNVVLFAKTTLEHNGNEKFFLYDGTKILQCDFNGDVYYDRSNVVLVVDPQNGELLSQGILCCPYVAGVSTISAKNNRIIGQAYYTRDVVFADTSFSHDTGNSSCLGLAIWDYDGNQLSFIDYNACSVSNSPVGAYLHDSILYLTGVVYSGAEFGDNILSSYPDSRVYIAKYVDTAFMHPYVHHGDLQDIQLVVRGGEPVATVYPNPCAQRVTVDWDGDEPPVAATVTDITGRTYSVALAAAGAGHSDSEAKITGRYTIDFSSLPAANYLLTITTPSGHRVTTRLLKR